MKETATAAAANPAQFERDRFDSQIRRQPGGCWLWLGAVDRVGYPQFRFRGRLWKAHRLSFLWNKGPVPDGYEVHHRCYSKRCVNPDHLQVVTSEEHHQIEAEYRRRRKAAGTTGEKNDG